MSLIRKDLKSMFKLHTQPWIKNTLLVTFIFLLLNIFLGVSLYLNTLSEQVQEKLGVYLYLNDIPGQESQVYNQVLLMKNELEKHGAKITFVSKDDALGLLTKKIPDLTKNFEKFNIDNPLQSTLYITFGNKDAYENIKNVINKNKSIVDNYGDIEKGTSLHSQNNRVLGIMNLSRFARVLFYIMVGLLGFLVVFLLRYFVRSLSDRFHEDMYRKKIMGANKKQIVLPLLYYTLISMIVGVLLAAALTLCVGVILNYYVFNSFGINSLTYILSTEFLVALGIEIIVIIFASSIISISYFYKMNKKLK